MKTMNVIKMFITLIIIGVIAMSSGYAAKPAAQTLHQKMVEAVNYPDFLLKSGTGEVEIIFTLTADGKINIEKIIASNKDLAKYVKEKVTNVCCADVISPYNQHYKVKFRFTLTS